jgi:hypothetical protein
MIAVWVLALTSIGIAVAAFSLAVIQVMRRKE